MKNIPGQFGARGDPCPVTWSPHARKGGSEPPPPHGGSRGGWICGKGEKAGAGGARRAGSPTPQMPGGYYSQAVGGVGNTPSAILIR